MYKAHVLSYIEYKTPAIYHACAAVLDNVDAVQRRFLNEIGVDDITALQSFNLAPLRTRRDIAMLGVIQRAALDKGPLQLRQLFPPERVIGRRSGRIALARHNRQREVLLGQNDLQMMDRSAFALVRIYNRLPQHLIDTTSISVFQAKLQKIVKARAQQGDADWMDTFSPRLSLDNHPVQHLGPIL